MPIRRSPGPTSFISTSLKSTSPESGCSSPAMSFSRVVLPQPLGPSTTIVWPSGTRRVKSRIATVDLRPPPQIPEDSLSVLQTSRRSICATGTPRPVRLGVRQRSMEYYRRQSQAVAQHECATCVRLETGRELATCAAEIPNHPSPLGVMSCNTRGQQITSALPPKGDLSEAYGFVAMGHLRCSGYRLVTSDLPR